MRVLIFEQWKGGHYTNYLEYIVPAMSAMSSELVLAVTKGFFDSSDFQRVCRASEKCANLQFDLDVPEANPACPWQDRLKLLSNLRKAIHRNKPDYVFVPSGDAQNIALGLGAPFSPGRLSTSVASECIIHWGYGPGAMDFKSRLKRTIYDTSFSWSSWRRLNFVNFLLYESHAGKDQHSRIGMVPDPVPRPPLMSRQEARRLLKIPDDGRMIGFVGRMDGRKAIPELLQAFRRAPLAMTDRLVLAGRLDPEYASLIQRDYSDLQRNGRLIVIDRWLTESEMAHGFSALDTVCLPYYQFPCLSSLMLKAIAAQRHVLVHDFGWMRAIARRFDVATVCNIYDPSSFGIAMEKSLEQASRYTITPAIEALIDYHSPANFLAHSLEGLGNFSGKSTTQHMTSWSSVMERLEPGQRTLV